MSETSTRVRLPTESGIDVFVAARDFLRRVGVESAFVRERRLADEGRLRVGSQIRQLVEEQREVAELGKIAGTARGVAHLQK